MTLLRGGRIDRLWDGPYGRAWDKVVVVGHARSPARPRWPIHGPARWPRELALASLTS
jgi:hypothetical protein